jgi:filamin
MPRPSFEVGANNDGSINLNYMPSEPGVHELNIAYNEQPIDGTPFRCTVDKVGGKFVTAYGQGLSSGSSGKDCEFSVVGPGDVDVSIDGPSKAEIKRKEKKGSRTDVTYLPMSPGEYSISIKNKGKHIHGSPFSAKISGEGHKRSQFSHAATSEYILSTKQVDLAHMVATLKGPSGSTDPVLLKKSSDGRLALACFQPKLRGKYVVSVTAEGSPISGSPFTIDIKDNQLCNAGHVKVSGPGKADAEANTWNDLCIDVSNAGLGSLGMSIEGPHRTDIRLKDANQGIFNVQYKPQEPGIYLINIKFGLDHVTGSPFMINVGGKPSGRVRETVSKQIESASDSGPGSKCEFQLKIPGIDPLDMEASLTNPSGKTELCEIRDLPHHLYDIKFTPEDSGIHTVSLKYKGLHISGSPFQYTVGPSPSGGTHKVEIGGPGLERGEVGVPNEFNIYTREAGAGLLSVGIEGLSKPKIELVDRGNGYTTVSYMVEKSGEYMIHVKYDDVHVPDSPCKVFIAPESGEAKNVTIHGLRDRGLEVGKPATFQVNLNGARGNLKGHVDTPSGTEDDLFLQEIDQDLHAVRFLPNENGIFYVHVKFNEAHIPGSPFPMLVGKMGADAALVLAKGDGLEKGECGKPCKFVVCTVDAGSGTLAVAIEGPSKVAIICTEVDEGYEFCYTPMAPGDYLISVKFCNVTIAGCPTRAVITGSGRPSGITEHSGLVIEAVEKKAGESSKAKTFKGDASKVVAKGNGLKKAFCGSGGNFTVDVNGAGQGALYMGMISQGGHPIAELSYKRARGTVYNCTYRSVERGDATLTVRWGNEDIPGSPFNIKIA